MTQQGLRRLSQIERHDEADRTFGGSDRQRGTVRGKGNGGKRGGEGLLSMDLAVYQIHKMSFPPARVPDPGFGFRPPGQRQKLAIGERSMAHTMRICPWCVSANGSGRTVVCNWRDQTCSTRGGFGSASVIV